MSTIRARTLRYARRSGGAAAFVACLLLASGPATAQRPGDADSKAPARQARTGSPRPRASGPAPVGPPVLPHVAALRAQKERLQGTWVCEAATVDAKDSPRFLGIVGVIDGDSLTWHYPQKDGSSVARPAGYRIDPTDHPGHFDQWRPERPEVVDRRLYALDGDVLRWSTNLDGKTRPRSMEDGRFQFTMRRPRVAPLLGTAVDPDGDCLFRLNKDAVTIKVPAGLHDLYYGEKDAAKQFNAPRLLRPVSGDFTAVVKVSADWKLGPKLPSGRCFHGAGLVVWSSEKEYFRLERTEFLHRKHGTPYCFTTPLYDRGGKRVNDWKVDPAEFFQGSSTWLCVQRRGQVLRTAISQDGQRWTQTASVTTQFPPRVHVGITAINGTGDAFIPRFEGFALTTR